MCQFLFLLSGVLVLVTITLARPEQRLVNSEVASYGQFPWMVSIRRTETSSHTCGATLVTPQHVVTAAHCVASNVPIPNDPNSLVIVTGQLSNLAGGRATGVKDVRIHPEYAPSPALENDIAVLKLLTSIPYTATEQPIPIASADVGVQPCVVSGWGRTLHPGSSVPTQLQTRVMDTMTWETCTEYWSPEVIFNSTLCVGGVRGYGVCSGDSGGPLICNGELAGVVSWANLCGNGMPDGFARVFYYRDWLIGHIADLDS